MRGGVVLHLVLVLLLAGLIGLHWPVLPDHSRRNYEFLPDMVESVAHDSQTQVPALSDGTPIDLRPPEGSVARGYLPLEYPATAEGARRAGEELRNPFRSDDPDAVTRGEFVFNTFCSVCHGSGGQGNGPVTRKGVPPPPSLLAENAVGMRAGRMYHVISQGQGNMASYAAQVERMDRWRAILYIRSLQEQAAMP